jgi:hypothetical protein
MSERHSSVPALATSGPASSDQFLCDVNEAFARLRSNEKAWAEYENEVAEWDHVADPSVE